MYSLITPCDLSYPETVCVHKLEKNEIESTQSPSSVAKARISEEIKDGDES
jgi:hypothetical protein